MRNKRNGRQKNINTNQMKKALQEMKYAKVPGAENIPI